jgi:hypothetical protein
MTTPTGRGPLCFSAASRCAVRSLRVSALALVLSLAAVLSACEAVPVPVPTGPTEEARIIVALPHVAQPGLTLTVRDESRLVRAARVVAHPGLSGRGPEVAVARGDPRDVTLTWWNGSCQLNPEVSVSLDGDIVRLTITPGPSNRDNCDSMGVAQGVTLSLVRPFRAELVRAEITE